MFQTLTKVCCSIQAFKYLYKYVYKGSDRTTVTLEAHHTNTNQQNQNHREGDEILDYLDARYVGPCEAA
jgi:hypothetical protein